MHNYLNTLKSLAEGHETYDSWQKHWKDNEEEILKVISRGEYLRIRPIKHEFRSLTLLTSQKEALKYLEKNNVTYNYSNKYEQEYHLEFEEYCRKRDAENKEIQKMLKEQHPQIFEHYPKFAKVLQDYYVSGDIVEHSHVEIKENVHQSIKDFYNVISKLIIDSIEIDYEELSWITLNEESYLYFGDYFRMGDGDSIVLKENDETIYYYDHNFNEVEVIAKDINDLIEREFVEFIKENL